MTTIKELNKKIEILTKEVKDLQESRVKADEETESLSAQIDQLTSGNIYLTRQVQIMTGVIQKQTQQIKTLDNASIQLASKSMENNLLIGGLKETDDEDCHDIVQKCLYDTLGIIKLNDGIYEGHRMGAVRKSGPPRLMLIKCSTPQRMMIMDNVKSLKGKKNEDGFSIYVTRQ